MIKPLIVANWKMHKTIGESVEYAEQLRRRFGELRDKTIVIAPPFTSLYSVSEVLKDSTIYVAGQNMNWEPSGSFTGEISPSMLVDAGCRYVILGHSERRIKFGENNGIVNKKVKAALLAGLRPILCLGESEEEREAGITIDIIKKQLQEGLNNISSDDIEKIAIAYEPVWAIGTGRTATAQEAQDVHCHIRRMIHNFCKSDRADTSTILYGGSVNAGNVGDLMNQPDINGVLVGGASLTVESFADILQYK